MRLHTRQDFCCWRTLVASECSAPRRQNSWHATSTTGSKGWQKSRRPANPAISDRTVNQLLERFRAKACPGLDPGWIPVRVKKTRQNNNLEPRSDSIGTEKALAFGEQDGHARFVDETLHVLIGLAIKIAFHDDRTIGDGLRAAFPDKNTADGLFAGIGLGLCAGPTVGTVP